MEETLIQLCRVKDEGAQRCKLLLDGNKNFDASEPEGTIRISTG